MLSARRSCRERQSEPTYHRTTASIRSIRPLSAAAGGGEESHGAGHLFDRMPKRLRRKGNKIAAVVSGDEDRLNALPEDVIRLLLSFLPSRQAVQMSVLAPPWRTLWKSLPSIRIDIGVDSAKFVNSLLLYRDQTPIYECEILSGPHKGPWDTDELDHDFESWLRNALSCNVRVLRINMSSGPDLQLSTGTLISEHLTRLILYGVVFEGFSLDVSSCQSLEELEMNRCEINLDRDYGIYFPKSLRLLRIKKSSILPEGHRSSVSAPGLVTLELAYCFEWTPWLKSLPSLVTASIKIDYKQFCDNCEEMPSLGCCDLDDGVLLEGLSGATNLELISHRSVLFRKEIKCYPMFSKLKTLLLSDWCMTSSFSGLVYFLQHSPILERLTLQIGIFSKKTKMREVYPKEQFMVSQHLKAVEITYSKKDGRVHQIVNFLAYHGVHQEIINIERKSYVDWLADS